nr:DUF11 domain-containing protein [Candidatus Levybacteria bacterium]
MKKTLYTILISGLLLTNAVLPTKTFAAGNDTGAYGQSCDGAYGSNDCFTDVLVTKKVQNPTTHVFVENLGANYDKFNAGQEIKFQILVKNTGRVKLNNIEVKDTLPPYIELVKGFGTFDANTKTITFNIDKLEVNEVRTLELTAKIVEDSKLPLDQGVICTLNYVAVQSGGDRSEDNSQFCIQRNVLSVTTPIVATPATGPEMLPLISLIPGGLAGFILRKRAIKK